jgi:quercetin dioxygenase-like cupin family protein
MIGHKQDERRLERHITKGKISGFRVRLLLAYEHDVANDVRDALIFLSIKEPSVHVFDLLKEQEFRVDRHVEKILTKCEAGDVTVACWEPGQVSPYHAHPHATEIYFCFQGGGSMKTPDGTVAITPGSFVLHPPGEDHEYTNGSERTLLFRVRYGDDMVSRHRDRE